MAQIIVMAKRYQKRPSEILNIDNDYLAYCFDEAALVLEAEATDQNGGVDWKRIKWKDDDKQKGNTNLIDFIKKHTS